MRFMMGHDGAYHTIGHEFHRPQAFSGDNQVAHGFHEAGQITVGQASLDILRGQ